MTVRPAKVVAGWATANVVLALVMLPFHENWIFIAYYAGASLPLFTWALLVGRSDRRHPTPPTEFVMGQRNGLLLPITIAIFLIGLGLVFGLWLCIVGGVLLVPSVWSFLHNPATATPQPDEAVLPHPVAARYPDPAPPQSLAEKIPVRHPAATARHPRLRRVAATVGVAAAVLAGRRGDARRQRRSRS